jgi:hypothetical protein
MLDKPLSCAFERVFECFAFISRSYCNPNTPNAECFTHRSLPQFTKDHPVLLWTGDVGRVTFGNAFCSKPSDSEIRQVFTQTNFMLPMSPLAVDRAKPPMLVQTSGLGILTRGRHLFDLRTFRRTPFQFTNSWAINVPSAKESNLNIESESVNQIIAICVEAGNVPLARSFIEIYETEIFRFRASTIQALIMFECSSQITVMFNTVKKGLTANAALHQPLSGSVDLEGAIRESIWALIAFAYDNSGLVYPNATLRLILVSRFELAQIELRTFVRDSGVVIDVLSFRREGGSVRQAIQHSHLSGGFAVFVENEAALREFVSSESFLNISLRPPVQRNARWSADFDTVFPKKL